MKKILIISRDGSPFELDYDTAKKSKMLEQEMNKETYTKTAEIELNNITSAVLERIVSYLVYHKEVPETDSWDLQFIKKFTGDELIDLIWSANFLQIPELLNLAKTRLIDVFENNNIKKVRDMLSIQPNFTKEEDDYITGNFMWNKL